MHVATPVSHQGTISNRIQYPRAPGKNNIVIDTIVPKSASRKHWCELIRPPTRASTQASTLFLQLAGEKVNRYCGMRSSHHVLRSNEPVYTSVHMHLSPELVRAHLERTSGGVNNDQEDFDALAIKPLCAANVPSKALNLRVDSSWHSSQASDWMFDESEIDTDDSFEIGQGSVSKVYKTKVRGFEQAALKILRHDFEDPTSHRQASQDFHNEFMVGLQGLAHPNIIEFLGGCNFEENGTVTPALVYEYMDGGCLEDVFEVKKMKLGKAWKPPLLLSLSWCTQLSHAVSYLHNFETKFAHRDIKPANVLVSRDLRTLKLGDFSLATLIHDEAEPGNSPEAAENGHQIPLSIAGSFRYMAPEVMSEKPYRLDRADVYSTALTCWTLVHGKPPFACIEDARMAHHLAGQGQRPVVHSKLGALSKILHHAWDADPSKRCCAKELAERFESLLEHTTSRTSCFSLFKWKAYLPAQEPLITRCERLQLARSDTV